MFEDSESESEADEAPAPAPEPKPVAKKRRRPTPAPDDDSDSDEDRRRPVGPGFRRDEWRADALARSGAGDFGQAGSFVDRSYLDMPITLEDARERGTTLGSGVVMAFTDEIDLVDVLVRISQFFRDESCGQCVPCRVGCVRQNETMVVLQEKGSLTSERRQLVDDIARVMVDASICGFGHTATNAINSAIKLGLVPGVPS